MDKKVLLSAVNAKYIHSNLAVRYLKKYCEDKISNIEISEFSINDNVGSMLKQLYRSKADIYGFSCYIWNISIILSLCSSLKKAKPEAVIILGGPEVSYDPASILINNASVDYVVAGEGEAALLDLLCCITEELQELPDISGMAYRKGSDIIVNAQRDTLHDLDAIPFPYDSFDGLENKIIYYETSRGCPFNCQYCLSSTIQGVRHLSMERVRKDINSFAAAGIKQVKLVDRTFNCDVYRSISIMQYIMKLNTATNFHFEIAADLINESFLQTVEKAPVGMFQFEIGVQSTNPKTLSEIKRVMNFSKVSENVSKLLSYGNAHLHLDLIAGLPFEDMDSFKKSFNDVYALKPDMLQLGFLKLLKGSGMRERRSEYGMEHHEFPPYEVIATNWLAFDELLSLKDVEQLLEQYYNSGRFRHSLNFLLKAATAGPFDLFLRMSDYWNAKGHFSSSKSISELYNIFKHFAEEQCLDKSDSESSSLLNENMKLDWLIYGKSGTMPETIDRFDHTYLKEKLQDYLKNTMIHKEGFEEFRNMSMRELLKHIGYEVFSRDIFNSAPSSKKSVIYYLLRPDAHNRLPYYTAVSLDEILTEVQNVDSHIEA